MFIIFTTCNNTVHYSLCKHVYTVQAYVHIHTYMIVFFIAPEYLLSLQGGKFDHANRLFHSIAQTWNNVLLDNVDLKEVSILL